MVFFGKKIIPLFVLISFLSVVFFSLMMMVHGIDGSMLGECPLSGVGGSSLCPVNTIDVVAHHISTYRNFFNTPIGFGITAFIIATLIFVYNFFQFVNRLLPFVFATYWGRLLSFVLGPSLYNKQITNWLSLLEHSPSR